MNREVRDLFMNYKKIYYNSNDPVYDFVSELASNLGNEDIALEVSKAKGDTIKLINFANEIFKEVSKI
jgi:hypothetical protein